MSTQTPILLTDEELELLRPTIERLGRELDATLAGLEEAKRVTHEDLRQPLYPSHTRGSESAGFSFLYHFAINRLDGTAVKERFMTRKNPSHGGYPGKVQTSSTASFEDALEDATIKREVACADPKHPRGSRSFEEPRSVLEEIERGERSGPIVY